MECTYYNSGTGRADFSAIPEDAIKISIFSCLSLREIWQNRVVCKEWKNLLDCHPIKSLRERRLSFIWPGFSTPFTSYPLPLDRLQSYIQGKKSDPWIESLMQPDRLNPSVLEFLRSNIWLTSFRIAGLEPLGVFAEEARLLRENRVETYYPKEHFQWLEHRVSDEVLVEALKHGFLACFPPERQTSELWLKVLQGRGLALQQVPEAKRTLEFCEAAVSNHAEAFEYVPQIVKDQPEALARICLAALKTGKENAAWLIAQVPEAERTDEMYFLAVAANCRVLETHIPREKQTAAQYEIAVKKWPDALELVPEEKRTAKLFALAVAGNGQLLRKIGDKDLTLDLCVTAVLQNPEANQYVPPRFRKKVERALGKAGKSLDWKAYISQRSRGTYTAYHT